MQKRVIVSGGGTAGHINPALGVAEELRKRGYTVLFVGAAGRMEMQRVPMAGFDIVGLPIMGLRRSFSPGAILHNLKVPVMMIRSTIRAKKIIRNFRPDIVVGFGGYASAPIVKAAQGLGIPTMLQEQNSFAGLTNRMLAKRAKAVCVAYRGMERFFGEDGKVVVTGNPYRGSIMQLPDRALAAKELALSPRVPTVLVTGGSLGTRTLNEMMVQFLQTYKGKDIQVIWQCGKFYYKEFQRRAAELEINECVNYKLVPFIEKMDCVYGVVDVVVGRSGASTVSELQLLGLPSVFVPSPNVAEDHQTANARSVVESGGAMMVPDSEAVQRAMTVAVELLNDKEKLKKMSEKIKAQGKPNATTDIADMVEKFAGAELGGEKEPQKTQKNVYFVGIGGIGMSALARFFQHQGYNVAGYDRLETPLTQKLSQEGVEVHYIDSIDQIPQEFKKTETTKVIYTPAIPSDHKQLNWFQNNGFEVIKRAQALGLLCREKYTMAVAGTHGKSSTTTMVAWLNHCTSTDGTGSAFLGAISKNFATNTIMGSGDRMAVEADEFDRSFHQLHPAVSLITAADPDHLDIYGTATEFRRGFEQFISQTTDAVIIKHGVELNVPTELKRFSYSLENHNTDYHAQNIRLSTRATYLFDMVTPTKTITNLELGVPGKINLENAVGAIALLDQKGFDHTKLNAALKTFQGIERRFDLWINTPQTVYMDDYAHHPEELSSMITSVKEMFPNRPLTICFQPHLYSRTQDFAEGFAQALSMADNVLLLPIYPARELPIEGVTSQIIFDKLTCPHKTLLGSKEELAEVLAKQPNLQLVVTAGAGDIDTQRQSVADILDKIK